MECIIHVFPDEYHLNTLDTILKACCELQKGVDIKSIIVSLIDRLATYASAPESNLPTGVDVFGLFYKNLASIVQVRNNNIIKNIHYIYKIIIIIIISNL